MKKRNNRLSPWSRKNTHAKGAKHPSRSLHLQSERLEDRMLMAVGPQLLGINPSNGGLLLEGSKFDVAPHELTFRFDENQVIDAATLGGIRITRAGGDGSLSDNSNIVVQPGFKGIGDTPNEVIVRFAERLPDDLYRIDIIGAGVDALKNKTGEAFNGGQSASRNFELNLGAQVVSVVPQPVIRSAGQLSQREDQIVVYFNNDDLRDGADGAENANFYKLIFTNTTAFNGDDQVFSPTSVDYDPTLDRSVLTFAKPIAELAGTGVYRLRIGTNEQVASSTIPLTPTRTIPAADPGSSFVSAQSLGTLSGSVIVSEAITAKSLPLDFPGSVDEPGHRNIPTQGDLLAGADPVDGVTRIPYNFKIAYGRDPQGNQLFNVITASQKQRVREVLELYSNYMGIEFYETAAHGVTIVSGDMRVVMPSIDTGPLGTLGVSTVPIDPRNPPPGPLDPPANPLTPAPMVVLDSGENWDDKPGGQFFQVAMRQIGRILGIGVSIELPGPNVFGHNPELLFNLQPDPLLEISEGIYPAGTFRDEVFPGPATVIHGQYLYRPDSVDIDLYRFQLTQAGRFSAETLAERLTDASGLDTLISLYRENNGQKELIARNDDYFSEDSFLELNLTAGTYYVAVSSRGNDEFDPSIENTGANGTSQGKYDLRLNFRPVVQAAAALRDLDVTGVSPTGTLFDGDADGAPGGIFNFWFRAVASSTNTANPRVIFVDKAFVGGSAGVLGSLLRPYNNLGLALAAARPGDIVRIVGNGGADGKSETVADNRAYEIGATNSTSALTDGSSLNVPKGVTLMVDAGAIFKLSRTAINVGSFSVSIDISGSAIQVLGTPSSPVIFTSIADRTAGIGSAQIPSTSSPQPGDWGGIFIRNDNDRAERRFEYEQQAIFLNHINNADMRYGGGRVNINSVSQVVNPIHLIDARPTISFNKITLSADAAMSANPDSFEESNFHSPDSVNSNYQASGLFTSDFVRIGPDIHGNRLVDNTTNGLFVRVSTPAGQQIESLTVTGRFDDTDVTHVLTENLLVDGTPGGTEFVASTGRHKSRLDAHLVIDPAVVLKLRSSRIEAGIGATITAEGAPDRQIIMTSLFDTRYGAGGTFATSRSIIATPGDWGGIYAGNVSSLSIDHAVIAYGGGITRIEGGNSAFNAIEIHQAHARIANSTIESSSLGTGGQAAKVRAGRGTNESAAIFVRGAEPIIIDNIIRNTQGANTPAISVDLTTLSHELNPDWGRSRGLIDLAINTKGNRGALIRDNRLAENGINGMVVRGGTMLTGGVWDDTTIVHVVLDEVVIPDLHTFGGLRLQSSSDQSLVVKFLGEHANFRATGRPLEIEDRVGGMLHVLGQPGSPVVMTSLADDSVGAGLDPTGRPQNDTDGVGRPERTKPVGTFQINVNYGPVARSTPGVIEAAEAAIQIWERLLEDPITVSIDFEITDLGNGAPGVFTVNEVSLPYETVRQAMITDAAGRGNETVVARLPDFATLNNNVVLPNDPANPFTLANTMEFARANALALGIAPSLLPAIPSVFDPTKTIDGTVNINFNPLGAQGDGTPVFYDLDRTDGILPGRYDLVGVVLHGIGHILGFEGSALEVAAMLADPLLPRAVSPSPLDLFKLEKGTGKTDFTGAARILDPSVEKVLYDGGFYDPSALGLVGLELGDVPVTDADGGFDHWDARFSDFGVQVPMSVGAIDPAQGRELNITEQDRQAMDLIGFNVVGGAIPSDWRGLILETASHDRNVAAVTEQESLGVTGVVVTGPTIENNTPATAQHLGSLASREFAGDENLRLGFEVYGQIHSPTDVDVYSFNAFPGTEVWFDIDRSSVAFDSVIELISSDGEVLVRSNNSNTEMQSFPEFVKTGVFAAGLQRSVYGSVDDFSQNIFDAGMRVVLPGSATGQLTYHARVRSAGSTENGPGVTSGAYNLQIRIREFDEHAGSTVQFADIGYATDAIRLRGLPSHSPLSGEVAEDTTLNSQLAGESENNRVCIRQTTSILVGVCTPRIYDRAFADAQYVGNLLTTDRSTISIAGRLSDSDRFFPESPFDSIREGLEGPGDVDWYLFEVNYDQTATNGRESTNGGLGIPRSVDVTFDVDYADGFASVDSSLQVYRASFSDGIGNLSDVGRGSLVFDSRQAYDPDDQPRPGFGVDLTDLSRGSGGKLDPFLGPVRLETGFYLLRVATAQTEPLEMSQFTDILPANPFIRMSPAPAATRLVDDPVSSIPNSDTFLGTPSLVPYSLGDLVLFGSRKTGSPSEPGTEIVTIDPFLGVTETVVGSFPFSVGDIALRDNPQFDRVSNDRPQRIHAFRTMAPDGGPQPIDESVGNYFNISPENGRLLVPEDPGGDPHDDQILTYVEDPNFEPNPDDPEPPPAVRAQEVEEGKGGIQFDALVFNASAADRQTGLAVGWRSDLLDTNIMYRFDSETGKALGGVRAEDDLLPTRGLHAGTDIIELGILRTTSGGRANSMMAVPRAADIVDGTKVVIAKAGGTPATVEFEFDSGMVYRFRTDPNSGQHVRDGDTFQVSGLQYEFDTGPVLVLNSAGSVADGQTLTLTDARGVTRIFEFDQGNGVTSGNMAIPISGNIADAIVSAVNGVGNFSVRTSLVGANRISLISDSQSVLPLSTSSGVTIEGALGGTGNVIRVEESFTTSELVSAIVSALPAASVGVSGERVNFLGASNLRNLISRGVVVIFDEAVGTGAGVQAVPYLISDTAAVVASRLVTATKTFETSMNLPNFFAATAQGDAVTLGAGATFSGTVPGFIVGGNAPGGLISGMAFVSQKVGANDVHRLFAVSDAGGLYEVLGFNDSPALRYITGSFRTSGRAGFTGLTVVPQGHALAGTLIASTSNALFAFDINGVPQPIFQNGATSIGLSVSDLVGIDFAIQPKNLWHVDDRRGNDIGHSLENATSLYFGDTGGAENSRNYDFAGGAHGTIISPQFSLAGYSENDDPYLYFTYLLSTEEAYRKPGTARDAFRVFVSDNATEAGQGQWHLLATNQLPSDYRPGALGLDATEYNSLGNPRVPRVEPLFDSTYQDVPFLIPRTETTPVGAAPNRQRDPFPFLDEDGKRPYEAEVFPDLLNETDNVWRQARISLKEFIGSSDLRLRFEFSTAASLDFGVTNTGGVELHAVAGTRLRDGDTFQIGTGASATTFEFDFGQSVTTVSGALLADGQVMVVDGPTGTPITLEFDTDGNVSAGSTRVTLTPDITASGLARSIADILRATAPTINVTQIDNKLSFPTAYVSTDAPFVVSGQIGVATGRERIAVTTEMTAANVAEQVQQSLARVFSKGVASAFPRHDSIVKVIGRIVSDAGPLGLADQLPGDDFGSFNSPLRGADNNGLQFGLPDDEARFTVQYEGVYLDDIIIGFASRGEATVDLRPELCDLIACTEINLANPEQELTGPVDVFALAGLPTSRAVVPQPSTISDGLYQVEIRRGSNDVIPDGSIDPRDRRANGVTLFAPSGADLFDGQLFTLGDGKNVVVFEFDDLTRANGVTNGNEKISFRPEFSDSVMAELIRDAVQNVTERRLLQGIIAATSDGRTSGIDGTTNRVNLFGNAFVGRDTAPNGIPFAVVDASGSGNLSRDQGQVVIASNNIRNSANYGIVSEAPPRGLPGENDLSELPITPNQDHSQFSHSDYASPYGSPRQLVKDNVERLSTGVVIANNVVAYGGRGGIHLSGDEAGYSIVAPVAGDQAVPAINEVWDELSFIFDVTDHNGLTQRFEFNRNGARELPAGTISVTWFMRSCVHHVPECSNRWDNDSRGDTADALMKAIQSSNLDVTVYRSSFDELYVAGATNIVSNLGNWFDIFARPVQSAAVPFARVLNNTIVGNGGVLEDNTEYNAEDFNDIGIFVEHSISPTLMNNVVANFKRGVVSDNTSQTTVVTGSTFQGNVRNAVNINATDFTVVLPVDAKPFTDFANGVFYPAAASSLIDSSIDSLEERRDLGLFKENVGIGLSPILAPSHDLLGQLRVDDPLVEPPSGVGDNVFKDRGALDRADITGPRASLLTPLDNDGITDKNSEFTQVRLDTTLLSRFEIRLNDLSDLADVNRGSGVNNSTVKSKSVTIQRDGVTLVDGVDYSFSYDTTNRTIRLTPLAGVWEAGHTYVISLANSGDNAIKDIAGHSLLANQDSGATTFTVEFEVPTDYGDAPDPSYPTLLGRNGARHTIVPTVFLGASVTADEDGLPSNAADGDVDDGVTFSEILPGASATFTITASVGGFLEGWIDYNRDGDWADSGEQVFNREALVSGPNVLNVGIPADASTGLTFARFRFSTAGGLSPTGAANDGEVEDYQLRIGPDAAWQNAVNRLDVNNDTFVTAIDALLVINELNRPTVSNPTTGELPTITQPPSVPPGFLDVNGDGFVTAIDALLVINELNRVSALQRSGLQPTANAIPGPVAAAIPGPNASTTATAAKSQRATAVDTLFAGDSTESTAAVPQAAFAQRSLPSVVPADASPGRAKKSDYDHQMAARAAWSVQDELFTELAQDVAGRQRRKK